MIMAGKIWGIRRKCSPNATLSTTNATWIGLGLNPKFGLQKPANNLLKHRWFHLILFRSLCKTSKSDYRIRHVAFSFRPRGTTLLPLDGFSWNLIFQYFPETCREKFKFHTNLTRIAGTLHEDLCMFLIIHGWIFLKMKNISAKVIRKIKTHTLRLITFFPRKSCHLWYNVNKCGRDRQTDDKIIRRRKYAICTLYKWGKNADPHA
jgi:hypothetical protein